MTLLFGKDLGEKTNLQKILGITKQGLKWASVGFLIFGPIGALVGLGVGMAGAAIKLGVESGFFKKMFTGIKKKTKEMGGHKKLLKSIMLWALILGPVVTPIVGAMVGVGIFYAKDKIK